MATTRYRSAEPRITGLPFFSGLLPSSIMQKGQRVKLAKEGILGWVGSYRVMGVLKVVRRHEIDAEGVSQLLESFLGPDHTEWPDLFEDIVEQLSAMSDKDLYKLAREVETGNGNKFSERLRGRWIAHLARMIRAPGMPGANDKAKPSSKDRVTQCDLANRLLLTYVKDLLDNPDGGSYFDEGQEKLNTTRSLSSGEQTTHHLKVQGLEDAQMVATNQEKLSKVPSKRKAPTHTVRTSVETNESTTAPKTRGALNAMTGMAENEAIPISVSALPPRQSKVCPATSSTLPATQRRNLKSASARTDSAESPIRKTKRQKTAIKDISTHQPDEVDGTGTYAENVEHVVADEAAEETATANVLFQEKQSPTARASFATPNRQLATIRGHPTKTVDGTAAGYAQDHEQAQQEDLTEIPQGDETMQPGVDFTASQAIDIINTYNSVFSNLEQDHAGHDLRSRLDPLMHQIVQTMVAQRERNDYDTEVLKLENSLLHERNDSLHQQAQTSERLLGAVEQALSNRPRFNVDRGTNYQAAAAAQHRSHAPQMLEDEE